MVKKEDQEKQLGGLVQRTEKDAYQLDEETSENPVRARGVGLREREWGYLDEVASDLGLSLHAVSVWLLRKAVKKLRAGEWEIPVETREEKYIAD